MSVREEFAADQVLRFSGLPGFPRIAEGIRELKTALQLSDTEWICKRVVSDWLARNKKSPTPADLLAMVWDENAGHGRKKEKCPTCEGNGSITRWYLVTYHGNSLRIKRSERLNVATQEEAMEFAQKIQDSPVGDDYQTVLSGAARCPSCSQPASGGSDVAP